MVISLAGILVNSENLIPDNHALTTTFLSLVSVIGVVQMVNNRRGFFSPEGKNIMLVTCFCQGSYRSWKSWKVMEFTNFIFKARKVTEFNCRSLKVMEIKVLFGRLVTADDKAGLT